jgi:hypothetical protein
MVGGTMAEIVGDPCRIDCATAFTVWAQSVVNSGSHGLTVGRRDRVMATVRWRDDPDGPKADRLLF